jgi:hypothetical protein
VKPPVRTSRRPVPSVLPVTRSGDSARLAARTTKPRLNTVDADTRQRRIKRRRVGTESRGGSPLVGLLNEETDDTCFPLEESLPGSDFFKKLIFKTEMSSFYSVSRI